ncbi:hypothetical protein L1987_47947 [Smallanthus sonchifolius]|uniref:Uncharacterized protein n=1 Tax=Smallanthus sonchifolius TaxID=185202 RepID=A0ACB9FRH3_9ASTR|nr:hypothetical protein L1987_47947 [Smallanthus sonchifolius]
MKNLQELDLSYNMFEGNLPQCINELSLLKVLEISSNQFTGIIQPSFTTNLTSLEYINFSHNKFEGLLSFSSFANHTKLEVFQFINDNDKSELETEEPSRWIPLFQLKVLVLSSCNVNKHKRNVVPSFLLHQHKLCVLDLSHNSLKGNLPNWLVENNTMLEVLYLRNNSFDGSIRMPEFRNLHFTEMDASGNHIIGTIPGNTGRLFPSLSFLNLSMNSLSGSMPSSINSMGELNILDLSDNKFSGEVPKNLDISLYTFDMLLLDNNFFTGEISKNKSFDVSILDISDNLFSDSHDQFLIPLNLTSVLTLDIGNNYLSGKIHEFLEQLSELTKIESLDLSSNRLSGKIPSKLITLTTLSVFNVSYNNLSGRLPETKGQFGTFTYASYKGNQLLCGLPLENKCTTTSPATIPSANEDTEKGYDIDMVWFIGSLSSTWSVFLLGFVAILYTNPYCRGRWFYFIEEFMYASYYFLCELVLRPSMLLNK